MPEVKKETTPAIDQVAPGQSPPHLPADFTLAHVSDLHLTSLDQAPCSQLLNKRMLGYLSWRRKRRHLHRRDIVAALLADLQLTRPAHIAVTGDLTHIGLPGEFAEAAQWLPSLGSPEQVTLIPGNHEAYAGSDWSTELALWRPYLDGDRPQHGQGTADFFPSLRVRGPLALIGLCSALPTLPFLATGRLGERQLTGLEDLLRRTAQQGLCRVVLVHHPPVPGTIKWRKRLIDDQAFCAVLRRQGADLVLHGHTHYATRSLLHTPTGEIPVIGAASASEFNPKTGRGASYNIYRLSRSGPHWHITMASRVYSDSRGIFVAGQEQALVPA